MEGEIPSPRGERGRARPHGSDWSSIREAGIKEETVSLTMVPPLSEVPMARGSLNKGSNPNV